MFELFSVIGQHQSSDNVLPIPLSCTRVMPQITTQTFLNDLPISMVSQCLPNTLLGDHLSFMDWSFGRLWWLERFLRDIWLFIEEKLLLARAWEKTDPTLRRHREEIDFTQHLNNYNTRKVAPNIDMMLQLLWTRQVSLSSSPSLSSYPDLGQRPRRQRGRVRIL